MPTFEYVALGEDGRKANGVVSADTARAARRELRLRQLTPLEITEAGVETETGRLRPVRLSSSDRILITRQLAMLIGSGAPVEEALGAVSAQSEKPAVRRLMAGMRDRVSEGYKFSEALAETGKTFPALYQAVVAAGEVSGDVGSVLGNLADYLEKTHKTRRQVQTALIYPAVLACVALIVVGLLMAFVVPRVVKQFDNFGQELPLLTQIVISISDYVRNWGLLTIALLVVAGIVLMRMLRQPAVKRRLDKAILKLPIIGKLSRIINGARFARTFSMLLSSQTSMMDSLAAARGALGNLVFVDAVDAIMADVGEGVRPASALAKAGVFPPMLTHLTASGAASEDLGGLMGKGADYLEDEFDNASSLALGLMEPLVIVTLGGIVALIVLSIMLPIMQLNTLAYS